MRVALRNIHMARTMPGTGRPSLSILEPVRIPPTDSPGMGDFVSGMFTLPQNPIRDAAGMGDFVAGRYALPQNPIRDGMSGCGCGGSCGPCRSGGMGAIDLTPSGTGIASAVGMTFPNWYVYAGVGALFIVPALIGKRRRR